MRLTNAEQQAFIHVLNEYIREPSELRLFGSRANNEAKGGDIDLLILVTHGKTASQLMYYKSKILSEIKTLVGDQKIDLLIATFADQDIFIENILPNSVLLHQFH